MTWLIDTNVAIHLRDGDRQVTIRIASLNMTPAMSLVTLIELEGGAAKDPAVAERRRRRVAELLVDVPVLELDRPVVDRYGSLVSRLGFSRRCILDRLIAATAIVHNLTLITTNGADFRDIPDLKLEVWPPLQ